MIFPMVVEETVQRNSPRFSPLETRTFLVQQCLGNRCQLLSNAGYKAYSTPFSAALLLAIALSQAVGSAPTWAQEAELSPSDLAQSSLGQLSEAAASDGSLGRVNQTALSRQPASSQGTSYSSVSPVESKSIEEIAFGETQALALTQRQGMLPEPAGLTRGRLNEAIAPSAIQLNETVASEHSAIALVEPVALSSPTGVSVSTDTSAAMAPMPLSSTQRLTDNAVDNVEIDPAIIEQSPTLQRWLEDTPNILEDIRNDPSFRTRVRFGYANFPSNGSVGGFQIGIEDVFIGSTGFTLSGDYGQSTNGDRESYGVDARYYVLPLGGYFNVAPVLGYRHIETAGYETGGVNVGLRLQAVLSRTGAADISLTQSWVSLFGEDEVGITSLGAGYAVTQNLRISTEIQWQNSRQQKDSRVGVFLEWMFF